MMVSSAIFVVPLALALIYRYYLGAFVIGACLVTSLLAHSRPSRHNLWYHYLDYGAVIFWCAWLVWMVSDHCGVRGWTMFVTAAIVVLVLRIFVDREPYLSTRRNALHVGVHAMAVVITVAIIIWGRNYSVCPAAGPAVSTARTKS